MTVGSYLNDLSFNGRDLTGLGPFDIAGGGISDLSGAANLFARALRQGYEPGGALSPVTTDIFFGGLASGLVDRQRGFERDLSANLAQQGVSPTRAAGIIQEARSGTQGPLQAILATRAQLQKQRADTEFGAQTDFASALGTLAVQSKQLRLQEKALKEQKKARRISTALGIVSAVASLFGGAGAFLGGLGALGSKALKPGDKNYNGGGGGLSGLKINPQSSGNASFQVPDYIGAGTIPVNSALFRQPSGQAFVPSFQSAGPSAFPTYLNNNPWGLATPFTGYNPFAISKQYPY